VSKQPLFRETTGWAVRSLRRAMSAWAGVSLSDGDTFDPMLEGCVKRFLAAYGLPPAPRWEFPACCGSPLAAFGSTCGAGSSTPYWFDIAMCEIGEQEGSGKACNNPRIIEYLQQFDHLNRAGLSAVDETAWCGAFVAWCLRQAGATSHDFINGRYLAGAKEWLRVGKAMDSPKVGAVTVVSRIAGPDKSGTTPSGYHVGLFVGAVKGGIMLLGGNQGNKVSVVPFTRGDGWQVEGHRWPSGLVLPHGSKKTKR
jgi:uncharacterized protein (TIGR02594 family)